MEQSASGGEATGPGPPAPDSPSVLTLQRGQGRSEFHPSLALERPRPSPQPHCEVGGVGGTAPGLLEAGALWGCAGLRVFQAPLSAAPWGHQRAGRLPRARGPGEGAAQGRQCRLRPEGLWHQVSTVFPALGRDGFGLVLHLDPRPAGSDALARGSPQGLVWFKESLFKKGKCLKVFGFFLSASPLRFREPRITAPNSRRGSPSLTHLADGHQDAKWGSWVGTEPHPPGLQAPRPRPQESAPRSNRE